MKSRTPLTLLSMAAVIPLTALALASCGGNDDSSATASSPPPKTAGGKPATLGVENSDLGKILDNGQGRTLYLFQADSAGKSACFGACASNWPPLRSAKPTVGRGANASMVGTIKRSDGKPQVTYNGHPLYTFAGDSSEGATNGQGINAFGGLWYAVSPGGQQVTRTASTSSGGGNSGGGVNPY